MSAGCRGNARRGPQGTVRARQGRGMVTAELAAGVLAVVVLVVLLAGWAGVVMMQLRCLDSASEIARQQARGDEAAVARAKADLPAGARVQVIRDGWVTTVRVSAPVWQPPLPRLEVTATAETMLEPGT
ncbi:TadE family type IV pilus minor pilin [Propionibacteriaceae bacterium Y2011]